MSPLFSACARAMPQIAGDGSTPVTSAPRRRIGSVSRPPPQPISQQAETLERRIVRRDAPEMPRGRIAQNAMRVGFSGSGLKSPCGSHQASAMASNLAISAPSTR